MGFTSSCPTSHTSSRGGPALQTEARARRILLVAPATLHSGPPVGGAWFQRKGVPTLACPRGAVNGLEEQVGRRVRVRPERGRFDSTSGMRERVKRFGRVARVMARR